MANNETDQAELVAIDDIVEDEIGIEVLVGDAMADGDPETVLRIVDDLHYADVADLLERLSREERGQFIEVVRDQFDPEVLAELDDTVRDEIVGHLGVREVASALSELDSDDAVDVLEEMDADQQRAVLDHIPDEERTLIEESLSYPDDSAGRLMQREIVTVPCHWNVGQCIDYVRRLAEEDEGRLPSAFYDIFAIDARHHPAGSIALSKLMSSRRQVPVTEIMDEDMQEIDVNTDQEDVAFMFRQRDLVSAPVVDGHGRLVGAITIDDVVDVIHEEHEEDIMRMGGVIEDDLYEAAISTTRARFSWLVVNLLTAILASVVIGFFDATIEQIVALAVLMPIVASMGGNAGTQSLTVTVRALATKELTGSNAYRVISKEVIVGCFNGVIFAILAGLVAWLWFESVELGAVIAAAMVINMIVAGFSGAAIPIVLDHMGVDPAIASTVVLTTMTDVIGFFAFLSLAAIVLL